MLIVGNAFRGWKIFQNSETSLNYATILTNLLHASLKFSGISLIANIVMTIVFAASTVA